MVAVMIGIDPHKASHTAVAIDPAEVPLGQLRVRACAARAERLLAWAQAWPQRTWAVEGAGGVGHLLDWQLVAAGERVLDVPPKLAARVRLLATGTSTRTTPTTPGRLRSRRCARPGSARSAVMITPQCSRSGPSAIRTWAGPAPRWPAGCIRCCAS
jgi:CO/xanthine dehydrogenase Mo-binding subunit